MEQKLFSKIKKQIENLFEPELRMQFCCIAYPMRTQWANNHIPRFYVKLDDKIIWDFPKDFAVKKIHWSYWSRTNGIIKLVRDYIDTPVNDLLTKNFENEKQSYPPRLLNEKDEETYHINYRLTEIFIAGDRRLGKEKLLTWAAKKKNPIVDKILELRFKTILRLVECPPVAYRINDMAHIRAIEFRPDCMYFDMTLLGIRILKLRPKFRLNKNTYLWISESNTKLPLIKCVGLPVTHKVTKKNSVRLHLYFPLPENWRQLDFVHIIEDETDSANCINQYKICLTKKARLSLPNYWNPIKSKSEIPDI